MFKNTDSRLFSSAYLPEGTARGFGLIARPEKPELLQRHPNIGLFIMKVIYTR